MTTERITSFGHGLDALASKVGGWPSDYAVFAVAVVNPGVASNLPPERVQVRLTGARPIGVDKHGFARWAKTKRERQELEAVVSLAEYRPALPAPKARAQ